MLNILMGFYTLFINKKLLLIFLFSSFYFIFIFHEFCFFGISIPISFSQLTSDSFLPQVFSCPPDFSKSAGFSCLPDFSKSASFSRPAWNFTSAWIQCQKFNVRYSRNPLSATCKSKSKVTRQAPKEKVLLKCSSLSVSENLYVNNHFIIHPHIIIISCFVLSPIPFQQSSPFSSS